MVIMDIRLDNIYSFVDFHANFSYPKKIVRSTLEDEHLAGLERFRYKRINVLLGANATGKTTLGKALMNLFNLIARKNISLLFDMISRPKKSSRIQVDMVPDGKALYRIEILVPAGWDPNNYSTKDFRVRIQSVEIGKKDSYEMCAARFDETKNHEQTDFNLEMDKIPAFGWHFTYPDDEEIYFRHVNNSRRFTTILRKTLQVLDPSIRAVKKISDVDSAYVISFRDRDEIIKDGKLVNRNTLSTGTRAGIDIALLMDSLEEGQRNFFYCDEKFSFVHSDVEKAFFSVMINSVKMNDQLFLTTHNTDILDMQLPKHAYTFLRKNATDPKNRISCVNAADYLKRQTESLRNAVENDLFSTAPDLSRLFELADNNNNSERFPA